MNGLARRISNRNFAWAVVACVALLAGLAALGLPRLEQDDDILAFLPQDSPEVQAFAEINQRFGSMDMALVGIETEDIFRPDFLTQLRKVTRDLKEIRGMNHVLTLANVVDFSPDLENGGMVTSTLIPEGRLMPAELTALRAKVLAKDHLVGHLISADGRALLLYCFLAHGVDPRAMAGHIRSAVKQRFPDQQLFWGGGPFVSTYIYDATHSDIRRLTPWAVLAVVLVMLLAFRDLIGVGLVLFSTGLGVLLTLGAMAWFGVRFNIVLGSMPVVLFAIGSAYGIHVLTRYQTLARETDRRTALYQTLIAVSPVVIAAGLTTAAGLLSFVAMDIQPLRMFGLFTALGILTILALSVSFLPAVISLTGLTRARPKTGLGKWTARLAVFARRRRLVVGLCLAVVSVAGGLAASRVDARMDNASFFSKDSPPDQAEHFLARYFGGGQFVQVQVKGDLADPHVLRELERLSGRLAELAGVAEVLHLGQAVSLANRAFVDQERIPDTNEQVRLLQSLLAGDPSVAQLVTADHSEALLHIKLIPTRAEAIEVVLQSIEALVKDDLTDHYRVVDGAHAGARKQEFEHRRRQLVLAKIRALVRRFALPLGPEALARADQRMSGPPPSVSAQSVAQRLAGFLRSDECAVDLADLGAELPSRLASALAALGPAAAESDLTAAIEGQLASSTKAIDPLLIEDLTFSLAAPLSAFWREQQAIEWARAVAAVWPPASPQQNPRFATALSTAMLDLSNSTVMLPARPGEEAQSLVCQVTGLPVMHRGLSASTASNQLKSLALALSLIIIIMAMFFRSLASGLLVAAPTVLTLLVVYGGMGLMGVHLDIGTSMLASLILGAGVDYAVHLASAWQSEPGEALHRAAARAAAAAGPAIWINAIMVAVGFFVLTLGEARPLKNVGGLTATAMLVAALATFLAIPVLARKRRYRQKDYDSGAAVDPLGEPVLDRGSK